METPSKSYPEGTASPDSTHSQSVYSEPKEQGRSPSTEHVVPGPHSLPVIPGGLAEGL